MVQGPVFRYCWYDHGFEQEMGVLNPMEKLHLLQLHIT